MFYLKTVYTVIFINQVRLEGGQQRRATDMIWSWNTFRLDRIIQDEGQRVLYYLRDGPKRSFVREELMLIPEETQLPPDYAQNWS